MIFMLAVGGARNRTKQSVLTKFKRTHKKNLKGAFWKFSGVGEGFPNAREAPR